MILLVTSSFAQQKILFDNTKNETAGNADWVIDDNEPMPSPAQSGITSSTAEDYWQGALSSWGVEMVKQGFWVETLPSGGRITYGDGTNAQDLSNYKVFVVCEPNKRFSVSERAAMTNFVYNGGGLFMVADHVKADRDGDGWDARRIWNDFMANNPVQKNPFGIYFDSTNIVETSLNVSSLLTDPILHGLKGDVEGIDFHNGSTMTLNTTDNSSVKAAVYQTGYSNTGTTGVIVAYATYGSGKVVAVGDSSVPEDATSQPGGGTTYAGWTEPVGGVADGDNGVLMTNATIWLAQSGSVVIDPEPTNNVTSFSAIDPTSSSIKLTWTDATGGTVPTGYLVKWNTSSSITNPVDGTPEADGVGKKNVSKGTQTATITGLTSGTTYYFKIFPYTNSGSNINYLVSSTPSTNASTTTETTHTINSENFDNCASITWHTFNVSGTKFWTCGSGYEAMNGYGGTTADEDWLISPALNLNVYSGEVLTFKTATQYTGPALELVYSTDYDGTSNPSTQGTWNSLTYTAATTTCFTPSGNISLDGISGTSVYIAFKYKATGVTSGTAALWEVDDILIEGNTNNAPTTQSSNLTFTGVGVNSMTINWTSGNGSKRIVKMNTSNSFTNPADGTDLNANTVYGGGEQVVFNSSGASVTVTGLSSNTTYWFRVYDYNGTGTNTKYLVITATDNPKSQITNSVDVTSPTVVTYSPSDNATTVNANDNLVLTFSENVKLGTAGYITIYNSDATTFETIPYNDSRISFLNNVVSINPSNSFLSGSTYYVNIDATVIQDMSGNAYAGISNNTMWNFTTQTVNSVSDLNDSKFLIYPNPASGIFRISLPNNPRELNVSVIDINGRIIEQINNITDNETSIDVTGYAKGVYIIKLQMDGKVYQQKLIVK